MSTKRSGWISGAVGLQLLYVLAMLALSVYLLALTRMSATRFDPDAAAQITGLEIAAAVVACPAAVAFIAWFGLRKEKPWGWWLSVLTDMGLAGIFVYSMIDDGWKNVDWDVAVLTLIAIVPVVYLFLPQVRRCYRRAGRGIAPNEAG